ncbi:MAG TPA: FISUMP domain-containing protein, partial [Halanaerobiales bacterium]|nr:FISUMP domain-containing protein [Halanaerobiales bacterium]
GSRDYFDGSIDNAGSYGYYWFSSVDDTDVRFLYFNSSDVLFFPGLRASGLSVRCLRDSGYSSSPTSLNTDYIKIKTNPQAFDLTNLDLTNVTFEHITPFSCGDDITFTYNGTEVTYGTVATSGECWMDRNLGASQVATAYNDSDSYGDLVQWGRPDDGHQERTSATTSVLADSDHPGHSNFITNGSSPYDWRDPQNDNMWNTDGSGSNNGETCPEGWRVPSESEWSSVSSNWSNRSDAFNSALKLPSAGTRTCLSASLGNVGSDGNYWSSSVDGTGARYLFFYSSDVYFHSTNRANGLSVRCLRDSD